MKKLIKLIFTLIFLVHASGLGSVQPIPPAQDATLRPLATALQGQAQMPTANTPKTSSQGITLAEIKSLLHRLCSSVENSLAEVRYLPQSKEDFIKETAYIIHRACPNDWAKVLLFARVVIKNLSITEGEETLYAVKPGIDPQGPDDSERVVTGIQKQQIISYRHALNFAEKFARGTWISTERRFGQLPRKISQGPKYRIQVICKGNRHRSPIIEFMIRDFLRREGLEEFFEVWSAGTSIAWQTHLRGRLKAGVNPKGSLSRGDFAEIHYEETEEERIPGIRRTLRGDLESVGMLNDFTRALCEDFTRRDVRRVNVDVTIAPDFVVCKSAPNCFRLSEFSDFDDPSFALEVPDDCPTEHVFKVCNAALRTGLGSELKRIAATLKASCSGTPAPEITNQFVGELKDKIITRRLNSDGSVGVEVLDLIVIGNKDVEKRHRVVDLVKGWYPRSRKIQRVLTGLMFNCPEAAEAAEAWRTQYSVTYDLHLKGVLMVLRGIDSPKNPYREIVAAGRIVDGEIKSIESIIIVRFDRGDRLAVIEAVQNAPMHFFDSYFFRKELLSGYPEFFKIKGLATNLFVRTLNEYVRPNRLMENHAKIPEIMKTLNLPDFPEALYDVDKVAYAVKRATDRTVSSLRDLELRGVLEAARLLEALAQSQESPKAASVGHNAPGPSGRETRSTLLALASCA
ncbi:MAG: hypothetical protein HQ558_03210 [Candidatus Omnitrophica bacterium]|nr:hypothetical protein [Candidatus Omnitrophota bacterium]